MSLHHAVRVTAATLLIALPFMSPINADGECEAGVSVHGKATGLPGTPMSTSKTPLFQPSGR